MILDSEVSFTFIPGFIINIVVAVIIYNDAKKRNIDPTLYIILTICCTFCIGGLAYLIAVSNQNNENQRNQQRLQNRGQQAYDTNMYGQDGSEDQSQRGSNLENRSYGDYDETNDEYGSSFDDYGSSSDDYQESPDEYGSSFDEKVCSFCGKKVNRDVKYCPNCGASDFE
jgi:ribosomal protein S27AE